MNKKQKEVVQAQLNSEKAVLKKLEANYTKALNEIDDKLERLLARQDADLPHVIYQIQYQKSLRAQVQSILITLHSNNFESISDYLTEAYQNGFVGSLYDIAGQGIPLIVPINQKKIVNAIQKETKLSKSLYESLDTTKLSKQIAQEISRGIANNATYEEMTRNIANLAGISKNNAARIARTEGHRIECQAAYDSQIEAKKKGADVVKQWDSTLDGRVRTAHRKLDGQIKEIEEPFEVDNYTPMFPGDFGEASQDCNCRCILLQRARWALDEEELETLKQRAAFHGLDKTKDFEDFKKKYLGIEESDLKVISKQTIEDQAAAFVPATTIAEAEQYAKDNFVIEKTWSGNGNVSYKGLSVESANEINRTLTDIYDNYDLKKLSNIQPMNFRSNIWKGSETTPMAYRNLGDGELYFNPKIVKSQNTVDKYIEDGKAAFVQCSNNIDKFSGSNKELIERYVVSGRSLVAEDVENALQAMTQHEIGHHIQNSIIAYDKEAVKVVKSGYDKYAINISGYATKSNGEYIAESFTAYSNGERDKIDPALSKIFDKQLKNEKTIAYLGGNANIKTTNEYVKNSITSLETIQLPKQEYAHVMSEINTHMSDEQRNQSIVSKAIGDYVYTFENYGFNEYRIIGKVPIDGGKYDEIERIFNE